MASTVPLRGLVCEDQALIAFELEACLEEAGLSVAGPFASCADALAWAAGDTPDFAILDFKLDDGSCTSLIRLLRDRSVPVLIYSGWPQDARDTPTDFRDLPWLMKPLDCEALLAALALAAPRSPFARPGQSEPAAVQKGQWT